MGTDRQKLLNILLGGELETFIRSRRADGKSWRMIERDLVAKLPDEDVPSFETLRAWYPDAAPAEAAS